MPVRPPDPQTLNAIADLEANIRLLESEERMLRQQLGLPPVTDRPLARWAEQASVPGYRGLTRARRRGPGRFISITLTVLRAQH